MTRLFERIASDEVALGAFIKGGPHISASLAKAGFDFVRPDMMFSSIDWKELDHILRVADNNNLTTVVRIPSNPWLGGTQQMQVTVDAARAFSLGVPVVQASIASADQVEALLEVANDWHRSGAGEYPSSDESFVAQQARAASSALLLPAIESKSSIADLDKMLDLEGLRAIMIAATDFSKELGYPFQYDHPAVWEAIDRVVAKARPKGITVCVNTGYEYNTHAKIVERVSKLYQHGVRMVMIQGAEFLLEHLSRPVLNDIRKETGGKK